MKTLKDYMETMEPATDLLGLQDLISKLISAKGVEETLYAIAIGLENSSEQRNLSEVISCLLNYSKQTVNKAL